MSHLIGILVAILLSNAPAQVQSTFYIELSSEELYVSFGLRTWLFQCNGKLMFPGFQFYDKDKQPPILCTLLGSDLTMDEIYTKYNFFLVENAQLPADQPIEFDDMFRNELPDRLFLAVSHDFVDYPDFVLATVNDASESLFLESEEELLSAYFKITNPEVFQEFPERFVPMFQAYDSRLKRMTDEYWQRFPPIKAPATGGKGGQPPHPNLSFEENELVESFLMKMIDPCFIAELVNNKLRTKGPFEFMISEQKASDSCNTYCRFLGIVPRVFKDEGKLPVQCRGIYLGSCIENTCWCAASPNLLRWYILKVSMAECNNHMVSIWSNWQILRFSPMWKSTSWWDGILPGRPSSVSNGRPKTSGLP